MCGLTALVLWRASFWDLPAEMGKIGWPAAVAGLCLNAPLVALWAVRSHLVLSRLSYRLPVWQLVMVTTLGNVAGTLTPGGLGDLLRGATLKDRHGLHGASAYSVVFYERLYLPILMLLAIALAAVMQAVAGPIWTIAALMVAGALAAGAGGFTYVLASALVRSRTPRAWKERLARRGGWLGSLGEVDEVLAGLFKDVRLGILFSAVTTVVYALTALQVWLVIDALGGDISLMEAWIAFAVASLAGMLTLLPVGLGVWDATLPAILSSRGVDFQSATAGTILLRGLQTLPLGLLAVACYLLLSRRGSGISSAEEPERTETSGYSGWA